MRGKPFYVERHVNGSIQWLRVDSYFYSEWVGCFCRLVDREAWL